MRKFGTMIAAAGLTMLGGCGAPDGSGGGADAAKSEAPIVEVTALELSSAFQKNEAKAQLTYEGKRVQVSGRVKDVDLDMLDQPVIKLAGGGDVGGMGISQDGKITDVSVNGLPKATAAEIDKGQELTVLCTEVSEIMGGPMVGGCSVVAAK